MAIGKQQCKLVVFIFMYLLDESFGSFIRSYVKSSNIRLELNYTNDTSLFEISYNTDASSITHILRFNDETRSAYTIKSLRPRTTYTFNITVRVQDQHVNESSITLTTDDYSDGDEYDDDDVHQVYFYLTIVIGSLLGVLIFIMCVIAWSGWRFRTKPKRHPENKSSIVQRMRRRQRERETRAKVPSEDISNYTNSIPGWNAR